MIGKIKALGLAFVAVAAMSAIAATGAQASVIHVGSSTSALTGHDEEGQNHVLSLTETDGGQANATCQTAWIEAHAQASTLEQIEATATYSGQCLLFGTAAVVRLNGCKYNLTNKSTGGATYGSGTATVDITGCTNATTGITIQSAVCQVQIPAQNGLSHVVGSNVAGGITLAATVTGITVKQVGAACPDGNNHHSTNASFQGNTIVGAKSVPATQQVTEHGHQFLKVSASGAAQSLTVT